MPVVIPVQPGDVGGAEYRFGCGVENTSLLFDLHWNRREDRWYMSIYDAAEVPVVRGVKIVLGTFLGRRAAHPLFEAGALVAVDLSRRGAEAGFLDLGRRVVLRWYAVQELIAGAGFAPLPGTVSG